MKLKIIPPRRPLHILSSDEISAVEALLMLSHCRDDSSSPPDPQTTNYSTAPTTTIVSKRSTAAVSDQNPLISGKANHECFICHKVFSTSQALGGHQTTHRRLKSSQVFSTSQALGGHQTTHRRLKSSHGGSTRPCNNAAAITTILDHISLCGKKRKHDNYEGKIGIKINKSSDGINNSGATSSSDEAASTRLRLNIDLNLPPAPEFC